MRETGNDAVMERVDASGNLLGFPVMNVSALPKDTPLTAELVTNAGRDDAGSLRRPVCNLESRPYRQLQRR